MGRFSSTRGRRLSTYEATLERFASSRPGAWAFMHLLSPVDRRLLPLTRGRISLARGAPVGMLETIGARSGRRRRTALLYRRDGAALLLVASNCGAPRHPAWLHNLRADPAVRFLTPERGWRTYRARVATGAERARHWPEMTDFYAGYAAYATRIEREIPLVILDPA
jgi:deazaflavin-dependent oxidoreductase (nitroreductase family)